MEMFIDGRWVESAQTTPVISPYSGQVVDTVPDATSEQAGQSLAAAERDAKEMANLTAYERYQILMRAADIFANKIEEFARTVTSEQGKPQAESRGEAGRVPDLLRLCAFEGSQMRGETLPVDAQSGGRGKVGITLRVPCGVVLAISPFNYPLLLVLHKVGPALAAGNAVILKPASTTPLSALKFTQGWLEAGLPENGLQCITGSTEVGEKLAKAAGIKKLSLELGSNSPLVVLPDADIDKVAEATAVGGYVNAGQVCISTQRVLVHRKIYADFLSVLKPRVEALKVGDPLTEDTKISAMITIGEAERVESWFNEAVQGGARILTGGQR